MRELGHPLEGEVLPPAPKLQSTMADAVYLVFCTWRGWVGLAIAFAGLRIALHP